VRVVDVRARLRRDELVEECLARLHGVLAQPWYAVHVGRQFQPMPVNGRRLGQVIGKLHSHARALRNVDSGTRHRAVVGPGLRYNVGRDFPRLYFGDEVERDGFAACSRRQCRQCGELFLRPGFGLTELRGSDVRARRQRAESAEHCQENGGAKNRAVQRLHLPLSVAFRPELLTRTSLAS